LGDTQPYVAEAQDLIMQKDPSCPVHRNVATLSIPQRKYLSPRRKRILIRCRQFFLVQQTYRTFFGISIFPSLATPYGFG